MNEMSASRTKQQRACGGTTRRDGDRQMRHKRGKMVTCFLRYLLDPCKLKEFEHYGKLWIPLVEKVVGKHHGYFLPSEGVNNIGLAMFAFPTLSEYERYRQQSLKDPDCLSAFKYAEETRCIISYEGTFFRPVFGAD